MIFKSELGGTLGISSSIGSLTRILAPITSGILIDYAGLTTPAFFGSFLMFLMAILTNLTIYQKSKIKQT